MHRATGVHDNEKRENRLCKVCNGGGVVEDQNHFVWHCAAYDEIRDKFIQQDRSLVWDNLINDQDKFVFLFSEHPRALARFVKNLSVYRKGLIYK